MTCHAFPKRPPYNAPRAAEGHMPFVGHRSVAEVWAREEAAIARRATQMAAAYGFDPQSLRSA